MVDPLAGTDSRQYLWLLVLAVVRDQNIDRAPDHFSGRIAEDPLRARVPGQDDAFEILADDRVVRRLDDGRQMLGGPLCLRAFETETELAGEGDSHIDLGVREGVGHVV